MARLLGGTALLILLSAVGAEARRDEDPHSSAIIDRHLSEYWEEKGIRPSARAGDMEFLRRVCLDLVGEVPTPLEIREFNADNKPDKRRRKIDALLKSSWFAWSWSERMRNYLLGYPRAFDYFTNRKAFQSWLYKELRRPDARIDGIVHQILVGSGGRDSGAAAFLSQFLQFQSGGTSLRIEQVAGRTATSFLGIRLQCAQCHDHPRGKWTQEDFAGMAAFFTKTSYDMTGFGGTGSGLVDLENPLPVKFEGLQGKLSPKFLDGSKPESGDWRGDFADMVTASPLFARAFVNRVWAWFSGKGIVDPLDDMNEKRKPAVPGLLDALARDFEAHDYNLRHLARTICNSQAYQLTSKRAGGDDPRVERVFARARIRPLTPEQLFQSISRATDLLKARQDDDAIWELLGGQNRTGETKKYYVVRRWFIEMLVKTSDEEAASNFSAYSANIQQILHALNKDLPLFAGTKSGTGGRLQSLLEEKTDEDVVVEIFLSTVSRYPTPRERGRCLTHVKRTRDRRKAFEEIYWALLNTDEFIFNH